MVEHFQRHLAVSIAIICGSTIIMIGSFFWLLSSYEAQAKKIVQDRTITVQSAKLLEEVAHLRQILPEVEEYERKVYLLVPTEDELIGFSKWLEGVARVNRLSLSFSFQGKSAKTLAEEPDALAFFLEVVGPYENIKNFIKFIEEQSDQYLLRLDSLNFTKVDDNDYRAQSQGRAFIRPTPTLEDQ